MTLKDKLNDDLKTAMRGGDHAKRDALRLLLAANDIARKEGFAIAWSQTKARWQPDGRAFAFSCASRRMGWPPG